MRFSAKQHWASKPQKSGMALVLTLLILVLVTIFMTEFFFEITLEIRAIENFQSAFVAQSAVKSSFKAVLEALETYDDERLVAFLDQMSQLAGNSAEISRLNPPKQLIPLEGFFPDFAEVTFYTPTIRPIDHLFNLNRIQSTGGRECDSSPNQKILNELIQLMKKIPRSAPENSTAPLPSPLSPEEIETIYESICSWMDPKENAAAHPQVAGMVAAAAASLPAGTNLPKNRRLDRLSEIKLIAGVVESGIPYEDWKQHFTIYDVDGLEEGAQNYTRLNINWANEREIARFLKRFKQFAENADEIAEAVIIRDEKTGQRVWQRDFDLIDDRLDTLESTPRNMDDFFILESQWYEIRLVAEVLGVQSEINAIVYRDEENEITIKDFLIR